MQERRRRGVSPLHKEERELEKRRGTKGPPQPSQDAKLPSLLGKGIGSAHEGALSHTPTRLKRRGKSEGGKAAEGAARKKNARLNGNRPIKKKREYEQDLSGH